MKQMQIIGNVGSVKDMTFTQSGKAVINFSVAVNSKVMVDGVRVDETTWFDCALWGAQAETANQYNLIQKGTKIFVQGDLTLETYTGKDNVDKTKLAIKFVDKYELLSNKADHDSGDESAPRKSTPPARRTAETVAEDVPF